jgi:plasmid stability protein
VRRFGLFATLSLLAAAAAVTGALAAPLAPTPARAAARAYVTANLKAVRAERLAYASLGSPAALAVCGGFRWLRDPQLWQGEQLRNEALLVAFTQKTAPIIRQLAVELQAVHAQDPVLRAYTTYLGKTLLAQLAPYAAAPQVDVCEILSDWKTTGRQARFDWAAAAHLSSALATSALKAGTFSRLENGPLNEQLAARLRELGISPAQAHSFVG